MGYDSPRQAPKQLNRPSDLLGRSRKEEKYPDVLTDSAREEKRRR